MFRKRVSPLRIGIYVDVARDSQLTGIGRHIVRLVRALADADRTNQYLLYYPVPLGSAAKLPDFFPRQANFRPRPIRFPKKWTYEHPRLWWNTYLPHVLRRDRVDVFHGPNHFVPGSRSVPSIVTIHDLAYFQMEVHGPAMDSALRHWTIESLRNADSVIALSENTKHDIEQLGVEGERVHVIYGGGDTVPEDRIAWNRVNELRERRNLPSEYFLFVGAVQARKDVPFLIRSFAELCEKHRLSHGLVLAGPKGSAADEVVALAKELGVADKVQLLGYVDDWELPLLYKLASAFVLPTRYEGFTLVTIEAMAYGTPIVVTDTSSIREGVGDAALLVSPGDGAGFADSMFGAATDTKLRERLVANGRRQAARFTWERCAAATIALYGATCGEDIEQHTDLAHACNI